MPVRVQLQTEADVALHSRPSSDSDIVTRAQHNDEMEILEWTIYLEEWLHVRSTVKSGFIQVKNLHIEDGGFIYKQITDQDWNSRPWNIMLDDCQFRVSKGTPALDLVLSTLRCWGLSSDSNMHALILNEMMVKGYTYVSLELGRLHDDHQWRVFGSSHITIGYLGWMADRHMRDLKSSLAGILQDWRKLPIFEKPNKLIKFREFKIRTPEEESEHIWQLEPIVHESPERIHDMAQQGLITRPHYVEPDKFGQYLQRIWYRDQMRLDQARARTPELALEPMQVDVLKMASCESGLGIGSLYLKDLLAYLADCVYYYPHGYQRGPDGKLIPPFVAGPTGWHCSRNVEWQSTAVDITSFQ
jgi:hypothetical protein